MSKFHEYVEDWAGERLHVKQMSDDANSISIHFCPFESELYVGESDIEKLIDILTRAKKHIQENRTNC